MTFLTWILVGVVSGLLGGFILNIGKQRKFGMEIFAGTVGAFAGGILLAPRFDIQITLQPDFTYPILTIGIVGAVAGLVVLFVVRRMRARPA